MIGTQILNYEIKTLIGEGGMGNVYLGEHTSIGRKAAIKVLKPELSSKPEIRTRFQNEAKVMASLQHNGIVTLFDYHEDENGLYLLMEYVDGQELSDWIKNLKEPLSLDRAKELIIQILEAFEYAHNQGVVHRDVKPSNFMIDSSGRIKVLDFGIAKLVENEDFSLTKTGTKVGTPYYMSPEQVQAQEIDKRSDIYSLGVTFYELLTGFCPYKTLNSEFEIYNKIVNDPLPSLVDTNGEQYRGFWQVIEKATAKKKTDRFSSCKEIVSALKLSDTVISETPPDRTIPDPVPEPINEKKSNNGLIYGLLGVVAVVIALFFIVPMFTEDEEPEEGVETVISETDVSDDSDSSAVVEPEQTEIKSYVTASSSMSPAAGLTYGPENAVDNDLTTWWSPKQAQAGAKWLKYDLGLEVYVTGVKIHAGSHYPNFSSGGKNFGNLYYKNLRIRKARFEFSDGSYQYVTLADVDRVQTVYFDDIIGTSFVKIIPIDFYNRQSDGWDDYCISEFDVIEGR